VLGCREDGGGIVGSQVEKLGEELVGYVENVGIWHAWPY